MDKKKISYIFCICFTTFLFAKNVDAQDVTLNEVTFHPPKVGAGWVLIRADDDFNPNPKMTTFVRVWNSANPSDSKPVAYVSGYKARVSAKFNITFTKCPIKPIYVKAGTPDLKYKLPPIKLNADFEYPISEIDKAFQKHLVQFIPDFTLNWYYTTTPNIENSWKMAGSSTHLLMTVHQKPVDALDGDSEYTTFYYTSLYISCQSANGKGLNGTSPDPDAIVESIFGEFRDRCVKKAGVGNCMKYWGGDNPLNQSIDPTCRSIHGLLEYEDANCGEWSSFFQDMLKIHGITKGKRLLERV